MSIYKAKFEFQTAEDIVANVASSTEIRFQSSSCDDALRDAILWFANRQSSVPEYFTRLCAVDICGQRFRRIEGAGTLASNNVGPFLEWKIDANPLPGGFKLSQIGWDVGDMTNMMRKAQLV